MFDLRQISDYYDQTEIHYRYFWDLDESCALHYGIWTPGTRSFKESLINTNRELASRAKIDRDTEVLDAGCGVGGSALFLAKTYGCRVKGISLSAKQVERARRNSIAAGLESLLTFEVLDYCNTGYSDASFDVVWALESVGSAADKSAFVGETVRLLRPGGRLVLADYFKTGAYPISDQKVMKTWLNGWAISDLETVNGFASLLHESGFQNVDYRDFTKAIRRSSRRMYLASLLGFVGTKLYNLFRKASPFSRTHYKSGIAQYRALDRGLWQYGLFSAKKQSF